jgi:hypothetical protein
MTPELAGDDVPLLGILRRALAFMLPEQLLHGLVTAFSAGSSDDLRIWDVQVTPRFGWVEHGEAEISLSPLVGEDWLRWWWKRAQQCLALAG